ncbi:MlaD family protein [Aurantibacillus circumpalustris]|uniref:MlaD family protein n=1 Tax=Aurantibacillus circumpalustris TaxID=3036359 RepID=UPI00295C3767|nr:MlaD family protein [Aurantibacillus circumpalustris]
MKPSQRNILVGVFVLTALLTLIAALYFIGNKQNLFGSTFRIAARFSNVNGLTKGNNVRFAGIDIGTVESVKVVNDSSVYVVMVIQNDMNPFIRTNALASVGTDGLMGNKLVNINAGSSAAPIIEEGQMLQTLKPVEMDVMVRTLDETNQNLEVITSNLKHITNKINSENSLWSILMDTVIAGNVKSSFVNIQAMSSGGIRIIGDLENVTGKVKRGEGSLGALVTDTLIASEFKSAVKALKTVGDTVQQMSQDLSHVVRKLKSGEGSAGKLLTDTTLVYNLNQGVLSVKKGAESFDENMTALHSSWPFKKYFKKQGKQKK